MASASAPFPRHLGPSIAASGGDSDDDLAAALHEVSNALTVALGWLESAAEPDAPPESVRRAVGIALSRARQGRDIARRAIGAEVAVGEETCEPLAQVIADATTGVAPQAAARGVALSVDADASAGGAVVAGAPALLQVLTNLLLNALAFAPDGSVVRVEAAAGGGEVRVAVGDEGPGVPAHLRDGLLERGGTTRAGGAGIGLRHARALATDRGGSLRLAPSERGARFELSWPEAPAVSARRGSVDHGVVLDGARVLVVEDDEAVLELLGTALALRGVEVVTARTRAELDAASAERAFDAALVDLSPLAGDAAGALAALRAAMPRGRLVLISGSAAALDPAVEKLAHAWVRKPFEMSEITAALAPKPPRDGSASSSRSG